MMTMAILAAVMLNPTVEIKCEQPAGWTFDVKTVEVAPGVRVREDPCDSAEGVASADVQGCRGDLV